MGGPVFRQENIFKKVMIFLATFPVHDFDSYVAPTLTDPDAVQHLSGIGLQYRGVEMMSAIHRNASHLKMWETETPCGSGENNWAYAFKQWATMATYIKHG